MHVVPKMGWDRQAVPFLGDRQAVPFLGPCLASFFKVFFIRVAEPQCFGFNETLWLMATGRATVGGSGSTCFVVPTGVASTASVAPASDRFLVRSPVSASQAGLDRHVVALCPGRWQ